MSDNNFAFIITAYQQVDLVRQNIERIRKEYRKLNDSDIVIISTSDEEVGFEQLEVDYSNVHFLDFSNAPGSKYCGWFKSPINPAGNYISWRHQYLAPRILISISRAVQYSYDIGITRAIHLHSDSYIRPDKEDRLIQDIYQLETSMIVADVSLDDEVVARSRGEMPPMIHLHPEGMLFNLNKCYECGYGFNFPEIFSEKTKFVSHNYGSIESLFGQYAVYCLTGKNITKGTDEIPREYFKNVYFRENRTYHSGPQGFDSGLVNLKGMQPDAK